MFLKQHAQNACSGISITSHVSEKMRTPVYMACAACILAILLLVALSPPFVQRRRGDNNVERGSIEIMRLLAWGAAVFACVLVAPLFF